MEKVPRDSARLKLKKLTRIQLLREVEVLSAALYKVLCID